MKVGLRIFIFVCCWLRHRRDGRDRRDSYQKVVAVNIYEAALYIEHMLMDTRAEANSYQPILPAGPVGGGRRQDGNADRAGRWDSKAKRYWVSLMFG